MLIASLVVSLLGVLAAGYAAWKAFRMTPRDYTTLLTSTGEQTSPEATLSVSLRDLVLDQRAAARWALVGTALQFVSVALAVAAAATS